VQRKWDLAQGAQTLGEPITAHGSYVSGRISDVPYVYYMGRAKCACGILMESRIVCTTQSWTAKQDTFVTRLVCTYVRVLSDTVTARE
jgi:hypothetical protein